MEYIQKGFMQHLEKEIDILRVDFTQIINNSIEAKLEEFRREVHKELKHAIDENRINNLRSLEHDLFDTEYLNKLNIDQIFTKLSQFLINKLYNF